jgi:outer membrane protein OmpA-like peptidoglycan-associated protein
MKKKFARPVSAFLTPALLLGVPWTAGASDPAVAEPVTPVMSEGEIEQQLQPHATTRSFVPQRGLARRDQVSQSVSLAIQFELNSSALKPAASTQLQQLQLALSSQSLHADRFVVAGHTDAQGNPRYNKQLSLRRAETVKQFLVANGIDARRLDTVGYGSDHLLEPDRPHDPRNRRVEIRDIGASSP